jgi:F-type H+-transporting ATPase subunit delta
VRNLIVAKRYAKALFAVGKEDNALDDFSQALNSLASLFESQPEVPDALTNPMYPLDVRAKVMAGIAKVMKVSEVMTRFLDLLVQKKRAAVVPDIAVAFQEMVDEDRNVAHGSVISAIKLSKGLQDKVQTALEKITGKQVVLSAEVDPSIVGGFVAKVGDLVMDGSIKSQLTGLRESIKGSE